MRLSVETYHLEQKFGYEKAFKMLKEAGFEAVDYSLYWDLEGWLMEEGYRERAVAVRKALDDAGLVCSQTHSPFNSLGQVKKKGIVYGESFDESNPYFVETVRAMEVSAILGAPHTVIHNLNTPADVDLMEYNLPFFKSLQPYAEKFGIKIAIENLFRGRGDGTFEERIGTAEGMNTLLKKLDSEWFVLLVDTGHARLVNIPPQDLIRGLTPGSLQGLHVQDNDKFGDRHQLPFMGDINWEAVLKALKEVGYQGDLTFEIPKILAPLPDELAEAAVVYAAAVGKYLIKRFEEL
ncbi:MAG: sugar phosphate isomerase/epimerase [Oscillospiraceae bacterium]|nr:sugar phosphate isomerase/epimerase [Oscillospiraceae bacterium]